MITRRRVNAVEVYNVIHAITSKVKHSFPEEVREYVDVSDFAPEWCKMGSKVIDPITGLRGEVIGYDERDVFIQPTKE